MEYRRFGFAISCWVSLTCASYSGGKKIKHCIDPKVKKQVLLLAFDRSSWCWDYSNWGKRLWVLRLHNKPEWVYACIDTSAFHVMHKDVAIYLRLFWLHDVKLVKLLLFSYQWGFWWVIVVMQFLRLFLVLRRNSESETEIRFQKNDQILRYWISANKTSSLQL